MYAKIVYIGQWNPTNHEVIKISKRVAQPCSHLNSTNAMFREFFWLALCFTKQSWPTCIYRIHPQVLYNKR